LSGNFGYMGRSTPLRDLDQMRYWVALEVMISTLLAL